MKKILHDLYHGRIPGWDSVASTTLPDETREKILNERQYIASIMSPKDFERFKTIETLHKEAHTRMYRSTYAKAFKLGVMLMWAVFMNNDEGAEE